MSFRDERTGEVRDVVLAYPQHAGIQLKRISVLAPVRVALIGLSVARPSSFRRRLSNALAEDFGCVKLNARES